MKERLFYTGLLSAALLISAPVFAEGDQQQPGEMEQSGEMGGETGGVTQQQPDAKMKNQVKMDLAPHSVMIQSSLASAREHLRGLRTEFKVSEGQPTTPYITHFQMLSKEINDSVKAANVHKGELQGSIKRFPNVARSDDYKQVQSSVGDLAQFNQSWQSKISKSEYWKNQDQVKSDLDKLDQQLSNAIDKTQAFNSSQLDLSMVG